MSILAVTGCATNKGITELKQFKTNDKSQVIILKDAETRASVLPILEEWLHDNDYSSTVITRLKEAKPENYILSYKAFWSWDMKMYMRKVEMEVKRKGETLGKLNFDSLQYGAFGKFGNTKNRLMILLDALFGKITQEEANKLLGEV